ncbi:hypothetical protein STEG23_030345 [Scotinomys teguina]
MLSAARRALQLLSSPNRVPRMGDSASKVISVQEALPGRAEPIPVAGPLCLWWQQFGCEFKICRDPAVVPLSLFERTADVLFGLSSALT